MLRTPNVGIVAKCARAQKSAPDQHMAMKSVRNSSKCISHVLEVDGFELFQHLLNKSRVACPGSRVPPLGRPRLHMLVQELWNGDWEMLACIRDRDVCDPLQRQGGWLHETRQLARGGRMERSRKSLSN